MDSARARLVGALQEQDPHRRLRLYHAFTAGGQPIYVHAKVMVIDDDVIRVGSSNFNNRSLRLDTECDIVIDAGESANQKDKGIIAGIRNSLLAEHLDTNCEGIERTLAETGSIIATIERFAGEGRTLRPYEVPDLSEVRTWLADNKILDPEGPGEMFESIFERKDLLHRLGRHRRMRRQDGQVDQLFVLGMVGAGLTIFGSAALALQMKKTRKARARRRQTEENRSR
jgi:phosphatidylserine/phosphatidylglycerophosphate/cardiolipin synthase-like enzyme